MRTVVRAALLGALLLTAFPTASTPATIRVPADQPTIQAGINAASPGDTVLVAPGTYGGGIIINSEDYFLLSETGPTETTIDMRGAPGLGLNMSWSSSIIDGFTFANAFMPPAPQNGQGTTGGAIRCQGNTQPTIRNCVFSANAAERGAAIFSGDNGTLIVSNCRFENNSTTLDGGALYCTSVTIETCVFTSNFAGVGSSGSGGALSFRSGTISGCTFDGNAAGSGGAIDIRESGLVTDSSFTSNVASGDGGAMRAGSLSLTVENCDFSGNRAQRGGAIYNNFGSPTINSSRFFENEAFEAGGATFIEGTSANTPLFVQCLFADNVTSSGGSAISCEAFGSPTLSNCTIVNGIGGNAQVFLGTSAGPTHATLLNTIVASSATGAALSCETGANASLSCCDLFGNLGGNYIGCIADQLGQDGNISADPLFCDPSAGDFTLATDSPCAPDNSPEGCGLIGAFDVGCGTTASLPDGLLAETTWGAVKASFGGRERP